MRCGSRKSKTRTNLTERAMLRVREVAACESWTFREREMRGDPRLVHVRLSITAD
jgi:hypothetical protein